jgi:hypothetical protein
MADGTWDFYFTHDGEAPLLVALDLAFGDPAARGERPVRLIVSVPMKAPQKNGLRSPQEAPALFALEGRLAEVLTAAGWVAVGRVVTRGRTDFIFHGADEQVPAFPESDYAMGRLVHRDEAWDLYGNLLWPGPREWQQMQNRRGLIQLRDAGDRLDAPRPIAHTARAIDEEAARAGAAALTTAGFVVGDVGEGSDGWSLTFTRTDAPNRIDAVTAQILDVLEGMEDVGYAGWTCEVVA